MTAHRVRLPNGDIQNFETGVAIRGQDLSSADGAKILNLLLPGETALRRLYDWVIEAETRIQAAQTSVPFATPQETIDGVNSVKPINPVDLKAAFDNIRAGAPTALDSFAEFVTAINGDPQFATHMFALIAAKAPSFNSVFTGLVTVPTATDTSDPKHVVNVRYMEAQIEAMLLNLKPPPSSPALTGDTFAVVGTQYVLSLSSTPSDPRLSVVSFDISFGNAAPVTVNASGNAATYVWNATGTVDSTLTITAIAKDSKNKYSPSSSKTITLLSELIRHPAIVAPADNSLNNALDPTITLDAFSPNVGTDTHVSTSWTIREASGNAVVWSSPNDTVNLTSITVPQDILTNSRQYVIEASYTGLTLGTSGVGRSHFTTVSQKLAPGINNLPVAIAGQDLILSITTLLSAPDTAWRRVGYAIANETNIHWTNQAGSASPLTTDVSIPYADLVFTNNAVNVFVYTEGNHSGKSVAAQMSVPRMQITPPVITYPSYAGSIPMDNIPLQPTFQINGYTTNIPNDTHLSTSWVLTNLSTGLVEQQVIKSTTDLLSWTPSKQLTAGLTYSLAVTVYGVVNTSGVSSITSVFNSTFTPLQRVENRQVYNGSGQALGGSFMRMSVNQDASALSWSTPTFQETRPNPQTGVMATYNTGRAQFLSSTTSAVILDPSFSLQDGQYGEDFGWVNKMSPTNNVIFNATNGTGKYNIGVFTWINAGTSINPLYLYPSQVTTSPALYHRFIDASFNLSGNTAVVADGTGVGPGPTPVIDQIYIQTVYPLNGTVDAMNILHVNTAIPATWTDGVDNYVPALSSQSGITQIKLSDDAQTLAIFTPYYAAASGYLRPAVSVFTKVNNDWVFSTLLTSSQDKNPSFVLGLCTDNKNQFDMSGDGNVIFIGGAYKPVTVSAGSVSVYRKIGGVWTAQADLDYLPHAGTPFDLSLCYFGMKVATNSDGSVVVVGSASLTAPNSAQTNAAIPKHGTFDIYTSADLTTWIAKGVEMVPSYGYTSISDNLNEAGSGSGGFGKNPIALSRDGTWFYIVEPWYTPVTSTKGLILGYHISTY